ncbi:MAG TPA: type III pantothenate kinase [Rhodocyclaceae bacterium]
MDSPLHAVCDLGNSRLKWGVGRLDGDTPEWVAHGALDYAALDQLPGRLVAAGAAGEVLAACVAAPEREQALSAALAATGFAVRYFSAAADCCGVRNGYARPTQLGVDRWAALIGSWRRLRAPGLIVCAGTATTIDALDVVGGEACFRGGVIVPGLALMTTALADGTARLPHAQGRYAVLPDNTDDAIATGIIEAQIGAIERLRRRLPPSTRCLVTGGHAATLMPHIAAPAEVVDTLVLEGLLAAASVN